MARRDIKMRRLHRRDVQLGEGLTVMELKVLQKVTEGLSNKLIGDQLNISTHTVKFHVDRTMRKLGAHNRTQAAVMYVRGQYKVTVV